ncbi:MAG: hypothetical protein WCQ99_06980, partial [Pseudomonadota bacterium]
MKKNSRSIKYYCRAILIAGCLFIVHNLYAQEKAASDTPLPVKIQNDGSGKAPEVNLRDAFQPEAEYYNDIALYISGLKIKEQSKIFNLTKYDIWQQYVSVTNASWALFKKNKVKKISDWAQAEMNAVRKERRTVFYPFSGPDFLYVHTLFPDSDAYILMGLEPVGLVPDPAALDSDSLPEFFKMLDKAIEDALTISFFKTNDMTEELGSRQLITGTVPVLMLFLARTNNKIVGMKPVEIDSSGGIAYREYFAIYKGKKRFGKGVEIEFQGKNNDRTQKLYYFCADISDNGLAQHQQCKAFIDKLDSGVTTFIKSASYLMHKNYFSQMRTLILN